MFNPEGRKAILSIDGGGMRGVIPLTMLVHLEEQTGKPAHQLFDMVAGTSTGAIIAAGLALGLSAKQILEIAYRDALPKAFGARGLAFWLRYIFIHRLRYLYPIKPFVDVLGSYAQDKTIGDLKSMIVFMTARDLRTSNTYYIVNAGSGAQTFAHWPVIGAVAASGAAPIYFPPVMGNLIDGGVGVYGNPSLAAAIEAVEYIGFKPENIVFVSLGTGFTPNNIKDGEGANFWLLDWIQYIIAEGMKDAALQQAYMTRALFKDRGMDFRRYNVYLQKASLENQLQVNSGAIDPAKLSLDSTKADEIALMERIGKAYAAAIDWTKPNLMPWETPGGHPQPVIAPVKWEKSVFGAQNVS